MSAAMLSFSCETYIDLNRTGEEKMLVVNGNLVSEDTLHTIYLSWSKFDDVAPVTAAHLEFYVNGKLADATDKVEEPDLYSYWRSEIRVRARFHAGDEVRVHVDADGCHAESVSTVPDAPEISSVDMSPFQTKDKDGSLKDCSMAGVTLIDVPGKNSYYRITLSLESQFTVTEAAPGSGYENGQVLCNVSRDLAFDNTAESLLYRNIGSDDSGYNYYANKYNLFTDATFADGSYRLKLIVDNDLPSNYPDIFIPDDIVETSERRSLRFTVLSMTRSSYSYMNAFAFDMSDQSSWTFIDGIPYPSNVSGGTGMVSVMSAAKYDVSLK